MKAAKPAAIPASIPQREAMAAAAVPFRVIQQQRGCGKFLVAGAQHIGRADIAGTDLADIAEPGHAGEDEAEGDRAEQIAEDYSPGC